MAHMFVSSACCDLQQQGRRWAQGIGEWLRGGCMAELAGSDLVASSFSLQTHM